MQQPRGKQEQESIDKLAALGVPEDRARKAPAVEAARMRDAWDGFVHDYASGVRPRLERLLRFIGWRTRK
jgi:hypothetical protein